MLAPSGGGEVPIQSKNQAEPLQIGGNSSKILTEFEENFSKVLKNLRNFEKIRVKFREKFLSESNKTFEKKFQILREFLKIEKNVQKL